jgi:hypothetical protein
MLHGFFTAVGAFCCFEGLRSSRSGFYFSFHEKREVNKRNSPAGCSEAKIGFFFSKSTKRSHFVALNGGRFFTKKRTQFFYASPQRPDEPHFRPTSVGIHVPPRSLDIGLCFMHYSPSRTGSGRCSRSSIRNIRRRCAP